jgi:hypothetical protein
MFVNRRKRPCNSVWFRTFGFIVKQGNLLAGIPFAFNHHKSLLFIPPRSETRFKLFMLWWKFYIILHVTRYILVISWGNEEHFKTYTFSNCFTLTSLNLWVLTFGVFIERKLFCSMINRLFEFAVQFNGK